MFITRASQRLAPACTSALRAHAIPLTRSMPLVRAAVLPFGSATKRGMSSNDWNKEHKLPDDNVHFGPPFHGQQSPEYHRHSTGYPNSNKERLQELDTGVKVAELPRRQPVSTSDKIALGMVKSLRKISNLFFRVKYTHYAVVLETVAAVPGMIGGMIHHLRSLRKMEHNLYIKTLLDEAENERMHLMTFIEVSKPRLAERLFVMGAQGVYFTAFLAFYILAPRTAHRFTGYLEEEAVKSYTEMLESIDQKRVPNPPAPPIAIAYWGLPADATLRDVVLVVRADEMDHRDVNHDLSDKLASTTR